jgi:hypothetical protein
MFNIIACTGTPDRNRLRKTKLDCLEDMNDHNIEKFSPQKKNFSNKSSHTKLNAENRRQLPD